jgi:hypothetical protein
MIVVDDLLGDARRVQARERGGVFTSALVTSRIEDLDPPGAVGSGCSKSLLVFR